MKAITLAPHVIVPLRGESVIIDSDLATLYRVSTKALNQAMRRNRSRFPADFVFQLTEAETKQWAALRSQFVTASRRNVRHRPFAFTEHGALMAANLLKSRRAVSVSVEIVRAFIRLRKFALTNEALARKISSLEKRYDGQFEQVFDALRALLASPEPEHGGKIGFARPGG